MTFSRLVIEVQAVRIYLLSAVALSLTLAGCQLPSRGGGSGSGSGSARSGGTPAPFLGTPTNNTSPPLSADRGALTSGGSASGGSTSANREGVLAGRILDQDNRLRPGAIIQVIDLEHSREGAPLSVLANREGYFDINGLEVGHSYRLVARVKDSGRSLVGTARVVAPNVRVAIFLSEDAVGEDPTPAATASTEPKPGNGPTASLGPPTKNPGGVTTPLPGSDLPAPHPPAVTTTPGPAAPSASPDLIADKGKKPGEDGLPGEAPRVSVPGATTPVPPGGEHVPEKPSANEMPPPPPGATPSEVPAPPAAPVEAARTGLPPSRTVVPSCVRVGQRVENFSLYDVKGKPFEFTKDRKGKLVLLDFWFTECPPCRKAIPKMNELQRKYGAHGLEVIGVAYEQGSLEEKQKTLEQAQRKYGLTFNYRLLFGGGGSRSCPVSEQLEVDRFPTLVLLDSNGRILWRGQGAGDRSIWELEMTIYRALFPNKVVGR